MSTRAAPPKDAANIAKHVRRLRWRQTDGMNLRRIDIEKVAADAGRAVPA